MSVKNRHSYTCENCFNKMWMTQQEYRERSLEGLVYCDVCRMFAKRKPMNIPRVFTKENLR